MSDIPLSQALRRDQLNVRLTNLEAERAFVENGIAAKKQVDQDTTADEARLAKVIDDIAKVKEELARP